VLILLQEVVILADEEPYFAVLVFPLKVQPANVYPSLVGLEILTDVL